MLAYIEDLTGLDRNYYIFLFVFFSILIIPYNLFFYMRDVLLEYVDSNKADIYSTVIVVVVLWMFILTYILYYFANDFKLVFGKREEKENIEKKQN